LIIQLYSDDSFFQQAQETYPDLVDRLLDAVIRAARQPEYKGKVKIGKCNTEESPQAMADYGITSIPALLIFDNGKPVDMIIGAVSKDVIAEKLEKVL